MLRDLAARLQTMEITLSWQPEVTAQLASVGFDPVYGARPLRRAIIAHIEDMLSEALLAGELDRGDMIVLEYTDKFSYHKVHEQEHTPAQED